MKKPRLTEEEIEELNDLYHYHGYTTGIREVMTFLEEKGYSKVSALITDLRKEFTNKRCLDRQNKYHEQYKNSKLTEKLMERFDWSQKQEEDGKNT